jgi:hypothetical protein
MIIANLILPKGSMVVPTPVDPYDVWEEPRPLTRMVYLEYKEHHKHKHNTMSYHKFLTPIDGYTGFWYKINNVKFPP